MYLFKCCLLAAVFFVVCSQDSANTSATTGLLFNVTTIPNQLLQHVSDSNKSEFLIADNASTLRETRNITEEVNLIENKNLTSSSSPENVKLGPKEQQKIEQGLIDEIKPFLLFPFLLPTKNEVNLNENLNKGETLRGGQNESKLEEDPKPFIFFDFAFNIQKIPLNNKTETGSDSKVFNVKKFFPVEDSKRSQKGRRRRNTSPNKDLRGFFDDFPLFPDSEIEEFLPKSDFFLPDLSFHHKPPKKLSRKKRGKRQMMKNDLNFFFDAFDEAFMRAKRGLEHTDPILNFLRRINPSYEEEKKAERNDLFGDFQENPNIKWTIQRNVKRLNDDLPKDSPRGSQETPMIIVDKVVKIGKFHVRDDENDKSRMKKAKKREADDFLGKFLYDDTHGESKVKISTGERKEDARKFSESHKKGEMKDSKERSQNHDVHSDEKASTKVESKEIKVLPHQNSSRLTFHQNTSIILKKKDKKGRQSIKETENLSENFLKVIDSFQSQIKDELKERSTSETERFKRKARENFSTKEVLYEDLKKNITEVLNRFLGLVKRLDDSKVGERSEENGPEDSVFHWTEKEVFRKSSAVQKEDKGKRQRKSVDFEEEYEDVDKKERQVADLNYLFLTVTLPTIFVFALLFMICLFNFQVKGKLCTKLFRPRHVFLVEDESPLQYKKATKEKKQQPI